MELKNEVSVKSELEKRSLTPDSLTEDDEQLIEQLAADYNQFLNFDLSKEQNQFSDSIEDMLTKLEEFCSLMDMIRSDISLSLTKTLPDIELNCRKMNAVFEKVDKLEAFIAVVRQNVAVMEEEVSRAEEQQRGSFGGLMKKLTSIVTPKRRPSLESKVSQQTTFQAPAIFKTSDYFNAGKNTDVSSADRRDNRQTVDSDSADKTEPADMSVKQNVDKTTESVDVTPEKDKPDKTDVEVSKRQDSDLSEDSKHTAESAAADSSKSKDDNVEEKT